MASSSSAYQPSTSEYGPASVTSGIIIFSNVKVQSVAYLRDLDLFVGVYESLGYGAKTLDALFLSRYLFIFQ